MSGESIEFRREAVRAAFKRYGAERSVIVTGTFRSGSSYVCSLLEYNGLELLSREQFNEYYLFIAPGTDTEFAAAIDQTVKQSTINGIFRCKLMWPHRNYLGKALSFAREASAELAQIFPDPKWINVARDDKLGQAISFWRAKKTARWHVYEPATEPEPRVDFDFDAIAALMFELGEHDRLWADFHELAATNCFDVSYEEFLAAPESSLSNLLQFLGDHREVRDTILTSQPLKMQRDAYTDELRAMYLEQRYADYT